MNENGLQSRSLTCLQLDFIVWRAQKSVNIHHIHEAEKSVVQIANIIQPETSVETYCKFISEMCIFHSLDAVFRHCLSLPVPVCLFVICITYIVGMCSVCVCMSATLCKHS